MSPGFSESMRKPHEPCGARLVADVAHALLRAVSRLISTPALLFDTVCESCARTGRREESSLDAARRSACATSSTTCPTLAHPVSSTSGGLKLHILSGNTRSEANVQNDRGRQLRRSVAREQRVM